MHLNKDTVYIMEGDSFSLSPIYTPELTGGDVFWSMSNPILDIRDNTIYANKTGNTYVTAYSPYQSLKDSCYVEVMDEWKTPIYDYPDETIINARVFYRGHFVNPKKVKVAAFINGECRGVGVLKDCFGTIFMQFRVCGTYGVDNTISFRIYCPEDLVCDYFSKTLYFDTSTHGGMGTFIILSY